MAAGTKLVLGFENSEGSTIQFSYNYANPSASKNAVKTLMSTMISNGEIFEKVPTVMKSAKTVTTTENVYDLSA